MKLDRTRPFGIYIDGTNRYLGQEGRIFDQQTEEEVIRVDPVASPVPVVETPKAEKMTCNECGKEFVLPAEPKARRLALGKLRAHLNLEVKLQRPCSRQLYLFKINIRVAKNIQFIILKG